MDMTRFEVACAAAKVMRKHEQASEEYELACVALRNHGLDSAQLEVLRQLCLTGPVEDGDVCSKAARDDLLSMGLAARACVKGQQGFTVANYSGWDVWTATVKAGRATGGVCVQREPAHTEERPRGPFLDAKSE